MRSITNFIAAVLFDGLRQPANGMIPSVFEGVSADEAVGFSYDPEKAASLLDEAGYLDNDGDGFRETPEGEQLEINFAAVSGGDAAETVVAYYIQQWQEIGLNVSLATGRLIEYQKFHDMLASDDSSIDAYQATWDIGMDPNPTEMFSGTSALNYTRWSSEKNDSFWWISSTLRVLWIKMRVCGSTDNGRRRCSRKHLSSLLSGRHRFLPSTTA